MMSLSPSTHSPDSHADQDDIDASLVITELMTMVAYDTLGNLSSGEASALQRELGPNWQEQLLTPVTSPMTLRSGKTLVGGGCHMATLFFAKVIFVTFLVISIMFMIYPYVPAAVASSSQVWRAVHAFSHKGMQMATSCPVGMGVSMWENTVCGKYNDLLKELYTDTLGTVLKWKELLRTALWGASAASLTMARIAAFVTRFVRSLGGGGGSVLKRTLNGICDVMSAGTNQYVLTETLVEDVNSLLDEAATSFRDQSKQKGGAFRVVKRRRPRVVKT